MKFGDNPSILVHCRRCKNSPILDRSPLYARDGSGYVLRKGKCDSCADLAKKRLPLYYPIDPRVQHITMFNLKRKYLAKTTALSETDLRSYRDPTITDPEGEILRNPDLEPKDFEHEDLVGDDPEGEDIEEEEGEENGDRGDRKKEDDRYPATNKRTAGAPLGERKYIRDLWNRLLSDFPLRCGKLKNGSKRGRISFRGVSIFVPEIAELRKEVRVLCDLSPESSTHPTPCATEATSEDPARRLGIRITYSNKDTSSFDSQWCQQSGGRKIRVLNSLVDFLVEKMKNVPRVDCDVSY